MRYWLIKTEPGSYSIDDLARDRRTRWDGIRNPRARNYLKEMEEGDQVIFYHSSAEPPGAAGVARVAKQAYADPAQFDSKSDYFDAKATEADPRWFVVDVEFVEKFERFVPLPDLKAEASLKDMVLVNNPRLSVQPVDAAEFEKVKQMAGRKS
jgi:predicted RNA-binding protein with PUA-like domain